MGGFWGYWVVAGVAALGALTGLAETLEKMKADARKARIEVFRFLREDAFKQAKALPPGPLRDQAMRDAARIGRRNRV